MKLILPIFIPLEKLPPAISLLSAIDEEKYEINVIVPYINQHYINFFKEKRIKWYSLFDYDWYNQLKEKNILCRLYTREIEVQKRFFEQLDRLYDDNSLIWILHEETALYLSNRITKYNYIISIYELKRPEKNKKYKLLNSAIPNIIKNAIQIVVPEVNRAHITKGWYKLDYTPYVLPNKPYPFNMREKRQFLNDEINNFILKIKDKKIILYQGAVGYDRKLDSFIEAVNLCGDEYVMLILSGDSPELKRLKATYPEKFIHMKSLPAPLHLYVTSWAYIGVLSYVPNKDIYRYEPLNALFCAPNKIYEYSGFGIPMIGNDIPGLVNTIEKYNAGCCVDINNINKIYMGIKTIEDNYNIFSENSRKLFNDCDVYTRVNEIIDLSFKKVIL